MNYLIELPEFMVCPFKSISISIPLAAMLLAASCVLMMIFTYIKITTRASQKSILYTLPYRPVKKA
jgi:hypothetical protein